MFVFTNQAIERYNKCQNIMSMNDEDRIDVETETTTSFDKYELTVS